jgi:hypothetical protein
VKRREYDVIWARITNTPRKDHKVPEPYTSETATETGRKRAAAEQEKANKREEERRRRLNFLESQTKFYDGMVLELNRKVQKLKADIQHLQKLDDEAARKEQERNSWWTYLSSPIYGRVQESEEEKRERDVKRLQRTASRSVKTAELSREEAGLRSWKERLESTNKQIAGEKLQQEEEERQAAKKKREQFEREAEARRKAEAGRVYAERMKLWEEEALRAREARERWQRESEALQKKAREEEVARQQKAREQEEAYQKKVKEQAEARARRENERSKAFAEETKRFQEGRPDWYQPLAKSAFQSTASTSTKSTPCKHDKFWPKIEGSQSCDSCHQYQKRFAFRCPSCTMIACANCRQILRGEKVRTRNQTGSSRTGRDRGGFEPYDGDFYCYD